MVFPEDAVSRPMPMLIYVDGEEAVNESIDPSAGLEQVFTIKGSGVLPVVVAIDGQKYASFDVDFEEETATLTDGYYFDVVREGDNSDEDPEESRPEEPGGDSSEPGGDSPFDAPRVE